MSGDITFPKQHKIYSVPLSLSRWGFYNIKKVERFLYYFIYHSPNHSNVSIMNTMSLVLVLTLCGISLGYPVQCGNSTTQNTCTSRWCFWAPNNVCAPIVQCKNVVVGVPPVRTHCDDISSCKWDSQFDKCVDPCTYYTQSDCNNSPYGIQCLWLAGSCNNQYKITPASAVTDYCLRRGAYNTATSKCDCQGEATLDQCQGCPDLFDTLHSCSICVTQKYGSGNICRLCNVNLDCSNHAHSVSSGNVTNLGCNCNCSAGFTGNTCSSCDTGYFGTNCTACDNAYCNNHVKLGNVPQVKNGGITTCDCNCADEYSGPRCNTCANNHIDYPNCVRCDLGIHCNGNAGSVMSTASNSKCSCSCTSGYTGDACDICDTNYVRDPSLPGIKCRQCSVVTDCNSRATSVIQQGNSCVCSCRNKWDPADNCVSCNPPYAGTDCDTCMPGHINYPNCTLCTLNDCNNRASSVTSNANKCMCSCVGNWNGESCDNCPIPLGGSQCECSVESHCGGTNRAIESKTVTVNNVASCSCVCSGNWQGTNCSECAHPYSGSNCSECARGRVNYPTCDICDISICEQHRNPLTMRIRRNGSEPECQCVYKDDVTACAAPFYTSSCEACSLPIHCTGDAYAVEVDEDDPNSCLCQCRNASQSCQRGESTASPVSINPINVFESKGSVPVGIVTSGSIGGTSVARLKAISALCGKEDDVLDPEVDPLKLKVGNSKYAAYTGGVLGNCVFVLSPIIVHLTAVLIRTRYPNRVEFNEAAADLRFPYISLFFVIFMFHGMATCGLKLLIFGGAGEKVLGVSVLLSFNIGFLVLIVAKTRSLSKDITYFDRSGTTLVSRYFFGNGEWVSATQKRKVHRWGLLFEMYRPGFTWFLICECIVLLTITVVQVSEASRMLSCRNLAGLLVALFGGLTLVIMYFGPWACRFDNHGNGLILGLETVACGFLVRGFSTEDRSDMGFTYASNILIVVSYLTVAKGFIDPFLLLYVEWTRRSTIQDNYNDVCHTEEKCQQLEVTDELLEDDDFVQYPLPEFEMTVKSCVDFNDPICNEGGKSTPSLTNIRSARTPEVTFQRIASPLSARNSAAVRNVNSSTGESLLRIASYPLLEKQRNDCLVQVFP